MAQYNKTTGQLLADSKTLYEVVMLADADGNPSTGDTGINIEFSNSSADAFGRGRVSQPQTLGDYKHTYKSLNDFLVVSTSGGAVTYNDNAASATLTTNTTATSRIIHQTKQYHHYLPGKSQLVLSSFCFDAANNSSKKRVGYYDDKNGIFFEQEVSSIGVSTLKLIIRSFVTGSAQDIVVTQANWNVNRCDGTQSNFTFDPTKTQLFFTDFQWLGVGRVRCGFVHNGKFIVIHEFAHSNNISTVYWSNPNLPARSEVLNTAINGGATMQHICSTVMSEGGYIEAGTDFEVQNTTQLVTLTPGGTWTPIIAVRLKSQFNGYDNRVLFKPENISMFVDVRSVAFRIGKLPSAASLGGTLTWTSAATDSASEFATNATSINMSNFISFGGGFVASGNSTGSQQSSAPISQTDSRRNLITQNFNSNDSEVFVIAVRTLSTGANDTATIWGSIQWKEII